MEGLKSLYYPILCGPRRCTLFSSPAKGLCTQWTVTKMKYLRYQPVQISVLTKVDHDKTLAAIDLPNWKFWNDIILVCSFHTGIIRCL